MEKVFLTSVEKRDVSEGIHAVAFGGLAHAKLPCCLDWQTLEDYGTYTRDSK